MPLKFYSNPFSAIPSQFCEVSVADRWAPLLTSPLSPIQADARAARRAPPPAARPRSASPPPGAQRHGRARSAFLFTPAAWPLLLLPNSASARSAPPRHGPCSSSLPPPGAPRRSAMDARRRRRATRRASCGLRPPQLPHRQQPSSRRPARTHARRAPITGGGSREGARRRGRRRDAAR